MEGSVCGCLICCSACGERVYVLYYLYCSFILLDNLVPINELEI